MAFSRERVGLIFPFHRGESNFTSFSSIVSGENSSFERRRIGPSISTEISPHKRVWALFLGYFWEKIWSAENIFALAPVSSAFRVLHLVAGILNTKGESQTMGNFYNLSNAVIGDFAILCVVSKFLKFYPGEVTCLTCKIFQIPQL